MTKNLNYRNYPYTPPQLNLFAKEMSQAGGFDELMIEKKALEDKGEKGYFIITYNNTHEYKELYLTGEYESLRPIYNTRVPYAFWSQLLIALRKRRAYRKHL